MFIWFDNREAEMQTFKETYGVEVGISSFLGLTKKWEGGEQLYFTTMDGKRILTISLDAG